MWRAFQTAAFVSVGETLRETSPIPVRWLLTRLTTLDARSGRDVPQSEPGVQSPTTAAAGCATTAAPVVAIFAYDLKFPDQRQPDRMPAAAMFEVKFLSKAVDLSLNQANALACTVTVATDCDDAQASRSRRVDHRLRTIMIGRDHRCAIRDNQIAEQPQLGGEIMRDIRMVIHVVAR